MKSTYKWGAVAFGISLVSTIVYGQARTPYTRPAYITTPGTVTAGNVVSNGSFNSTVASGNQAYTCTNVGCRLSLGNTGGYLVQNGPGEYQFSGAGLAASYFTTSGVYQTFSGASATLNGVVNDGATAVATILRSNGTFSTAGSKITSFRNGTSEVAFVDKDGNNSATSFTATTATGSSLTGGGASGPLLITSDTTDSQTSSSVPAIRMRANQALTAGDLVFQILNSSNQSLFHVTQGGEVQPNGIRLNGNILQNGSAEFIIYGQRTATSTIAGTRIGNSIQPTVDGGKLASIVYYTGSTWVDAAHFSKEGLLRVNEQNLAKPTCNSANRGRVYYLDGAAGVADTYEICMKNAADAYAWKTIVTP